MTDNEIIKTLELEAIYCRGEGNMYGPTKKTFVDAELIEGALALINRQKAEIERLQTATEEAVGCFHRMESLYHIKCTELKVARAEAVKEFAERLKRELSFGRYTDAERIDNLVKEFTEGKDED